MNEEDFLQLSEKEQIEYWSNVYEKLKVLKKEESLLRQTLISELLKDDKTLGKKKLKLGYCKIEINKGVSNSIDESVLDTIFQELTDEEKNSVRFKPSLIAKEFNQLNGDEKIFEAITEKPSLPTIKIEFIDE